MRRRRTRFWPESRESLPKQFIPLVGERSTFQTIVQMLADLPIGCVHRLGNPGKINLELIEVQTGSYLGEDDIVRLEDVYNRIC